MFVEEFVIILNILYFCISLGIMCLNEKGNVKQLNNTKKCKSMIRS